MSPSNQSLTFRDAGMSAMRKKWVHGAATFDNQCKTSGCFSGADLEFFRMTSDRALLVSQVDLPENGED